MNKRLMKTALITAAAMMTLSIAGCMKKPETEEGASAQRGDIEVKVMADGNLSLIKERKLTFGVAGTVIEINVREGERVKEGDVLARLDTESLELTVATVKLAVRSAEIDLEMANDNFRKITYPYTYYTFAFGVPESLAAIAGASRDVEKVMASLTSDMNAEELGEAQRQLKAAQDNLTQAKEKLGRGEGPDLFTTGQLPLSSFWTLRDTQLSMEKAELALDKANFDLKRAQDELPKTVITSPMSGLVEQVNVKQGDRIAPGDIGTKTVFQIIDPDALELKAAVDEIDIAGVALGQKATVTLDAMPGTGVTGELTYIAGTSRTQSGVIVYDVKIRIDENGVTGLKAGMTAKADIVSIRHENVLLVPEKAVYRNGDGLTAVKVTLNGIVEERIIKTGLKNGLEVEVLEGLSEGDIVMTLKALQRKNS